MIQVSCKGHFLDYPDMIPIIRALGSVTPRTCHRNLLTPYATDDAGLLSVLGVASSHDPSRRQPLTVHLQPSTCIWSND
jgi:hypothetical protein